MKGITPVIAVILLLLITISLVGFAFVFLTRTTETAAESGEQQLEQQIQQFGMRFSIENVEKNKVTIRNLGTTSLSPSLLAFYVDNQKVEAAGPLSLATNVVGEYFLNDSKLAMLPDPADVRVSGGTVSDTKKDVCFYCGYYSEYFKFDGSGTSAADSSGNGNDAILYNGPQWISGVYGNALSFDAVDDEARATDSTMLKSGNDWTVSAWIKSRDTPGVDKIIVGKIGWHGGLIHLGSVINFAISNNVGNQRTVQYTPAVGTWYHYTAIYNSSNARMSLYVNGVLAGTNTFDIPPMLGYSDTLYMGGSANNGPTNYHSPVDIDEVKIMRMARSMTTA